MNTKDLSVAHDLTIPNCPITGEPAVRLVQRIKARFLNSAWKHIFHAPAKSSFGEVEYFGLWESPTGLYFFDPMREGNQDFYSRFYSRLTDLGLWSEQATRTEFNLAARYIEPGYNVLDVGCGFATFRKVIPQARYTGIDPHIAAKEAIDAVSTQTLQEHLADHAATYDAVCAFQVIEHLASPVEFFADLMRATCVGGLVIVGVPHVPSAATRLPNFMMNAPPHHLTWWTAKALTTLAERAGAKIEDIATIPWGEHDALIYWMERCSPIRCRKQHYRNVWRWHAATAVSYVGGRLLLKGRGVPRTTDEGSGLLLVARRTR